MVIMTHINLTPKGWSTKCILNAISQNHTIIIIRQGHIAITNYKLGDNPKFEKSLSTWNDMYYRYEVVGYCYAKEFKELRINRNYDIFKLQYYFPNVKIIYDNTPSSFERIKVKLLAAPRDDIQKLCVTFLAGAGKYEWTNNYTQKFVQLRPGSGKTYSMCTVTSYFGMKTVIVMPMSILLEQWIDSYCEFTSIDKSDIIVIKGSKKCEQLRNGKYTDKKVYLFLIDTIMSYYDTHGAYKTMMMLEATHAGILGIDECHLNFRALSILLAMQNFKLTIFLTASPDRTERKESMMFKTLFHDIPTFGENVFHKDEKYLNVMVKHYNWTPSVSAMHKMNTKMGMNTKTYESELINANPNERKDFDTSFRKMLRWALKQMKPTHRMLVLCNTIDGTKYLKSLCDLETDPESVSIYYGTMPAAEKNTAMTKRIICATASSCGTGFDMPNMTYCFNIMTYSSTVSATQLSGRVRKPKDGSPGVYVEFLNVGYHKCMNQYKSRKSKLTEQTPKGKIIVVT